MSVSSDGTIFLANWSDGLRAYSYDGFSFIRTAHIECNSDYYARGVVVGSDGTLFLANSDDGLYAYTYSGFTGIDDDLSSIPGNYSLSQNYPNPFNPNTTIKFRLPANSKVKVEVYNALGQKVQTLINKKMSAGSHSISFDGSALSSGLYFYKISAGKFQQVKKMLLIK